MAILTVNDINLAWLQSATLSDLKSALRSGGETLNAVNALLQTPEGKKIANEMLNDPDYKPVALRQPTPEEAAQIAADEQLAADQAAQAEFEAQQAADEEARATAAAQAAAEEKKKFVIDYQVTDEDSGRPIGRNTHLEAFGTEVEALRLLVEKLKAAHINAVRYAERLKNNRTKTSTAALHQVEAAKAVEMSRAESDRLIEEAAKSNDPVKMKEAAAKVVDAERRQRELDEAAKAHGTVIATMWVEEHASDFYPCQASVDLIGRYLKENNLPMSYENLDRAFTALKDQLPKPPVQVSDETSATVGANSQPVATVTAVAPAASITQPAAVVAAPVSNSQPSATSAAATAQELTSVAANQPTATRRPAVNGALQPGTTSARRPGVGQQPQQSPEQTTAQLKREIAKMSGQQFRKKLISDKSFADRCAAAGIIDLARRG